MASPASRSWLLHNHQRSPLRRFQHQLGNCWMQNQFQCPRKIVHCCLDWNVQPILDCSSRVHWQHMNPSIQIPFVDVWSRSQIKTRATGTCAGTGRGVVQTHICIYIHWQEVLPLINGECARFEEGYVYHYYAISISISSIIRLTEFKRGQWKLIWKRRISHAIFSTWWVWYGMWWLGRHLWLICTVESHK